MIRRLIILQVILLAGLGSVFLLPETPPVQDAAVNPELPEHLSPSGWQSSGPLGREGSKEERERLSPDTLFYRRDYRREVSISEQPVGKYYQGLVDELNAGIVMSGKNLTGSIHALERCLNAQGFNIVSTSTLPVRLATGHILPVRRLVCERPDAKSGIMVRNVSYYWFVGHDAVTDDHIQRGLRDFYDRVIHGYDQRWAYITITAYLNGGYVYHTKAPPASGDAGVEPVRVRDRLTGYDLVRRDLTPEKADEMVKEFLADLGPEVLRLDQIRNWPKP